MSQETNNKEVVAVVAGEEITQEEFNLFLQAVPREQQAYLANPQFRQQCLDQFIALRLYAKLGEELKLEETEEFQTMIANAKRDILAQIAMRETLKAASVSEEEAAAYYEENKEQYKKGETVRAKHILTETEEKCAEILAAIEKNEKSFEDAAKEFSTCPSGAKGGDLGAFGRGQMVKEFDEAVFTAEVGKIIGPVKTDFGYHLICVDELTGGEQSEFAEVYPQIMQQLTTEAQNKKYMEVRQAMIEKYGLEFK
mgnify:CR=1 FL=1